MHIDKSLNLVVPVGESDNEVYFYSSSISHEVFKKYHLVICKTFTKLLSEGLELTGAKIAAMQLEEIATDMGKWEGEEGVKEGLLEEITRLTTVLVLTENGWDTLPVNIALSRQLVNEEDWEEAKQRIVFFTLICAMARKGVRDDLLMIMNDSWGTQITLLGCMEFANSLQTLKETEISLPEEKRSSIVA